MSNQSTYYSNALQCAERLTLPLKGNVWRSQSGDFLGKGSGSSMDFQDHRNYVPGDDPRHINWQAYARSGTYTMKQYREEIRPTIDLVMDVSPSMFFDQEKEKRCSELLYLIYTIAMKNGADFSCHLLSGREHVMLSPENIVTQSWKSRIPNNEELDTQAAPELQRINFMPGSIRIFISDLLFEGDPAPHIHSLVGKQGKPILIVPYLKQEANPGWSGNYDFIDAEMGSKHQHRIDGNTLEQYIKQYKKHFEIWVQALQKYHTPFARVCADISLFESLRQEAVPNRAFELIQT